jgi:UDP-N-acetylmuramate--alanine ligase
MNGAGDESKRRVHFVGIGGSGLSAIARMLHESGYIVTGSDREMTSFAEDLQGIGIAVQIGQEASNVRGVDWVVRSAAVPDDNPEIVAAKAAGIPVYRRADFLGEFMQEKRGVAVAGTHGKTTTTAMIAFATEKMGLRPSFIVGGVLKDLGVNARAGEGDVFVVEADEYDRMFLGLKPQIEVLTSMEYDHPDCYPTFDDMVTAFESFISLLPRNGTLVACQDNPGAAALLLKARREGRQVLAYSVEQEMTITAPRWMQARNLTVNEWGGFDFEAHTNAGAVTSARVQLRVPGRHNVSNALAALSVVALLGYSIEDAAAQLSEFTGTGRRFELRGERDGVTVIDDYAHHPTEIRATLEAARDRFPRRTIWAVWQPHTYSRTRALLHEFAGAFEEADQVVVTEIYAAREVPEAFSATQVVAKMKPGKAKFIASLEDCTRFLLENVEPGSVLIVLSAGDADRISADFLSGLEKRGDK